MYNVVGMTYNRYQNRQPIPIPSMSTQDHFASHRRRYSSDEPQRTPLEPRTNVSLPLSPSGRSVSNDTLKRVPPCPAGDGGVDRPSRLELDQACPAAHLVRLDRSCDCAGDV